MQKCLNSPRDEQDNVTPLVLWVGGLFCSVLVHRVSTSVAVRICNLLSCCGHHFAVMAVGYAGIRRNKMFTAGACPHYFVGFNGRMKLHMTNLTCPIHHSIMVCGLLCWAIALQIKIGTTIGSRVPVSVPENFPWVAGHLNVQDYNIFYSNVD